jgi:hypothetical protein
VAATLQAVKTVWHVGHHFSRTSSEFHASFSQVQDEEIEMGEGFGRLAAYGTAARKDFLNASEKYGISACVGMVIRTHP